MTIKRTELDNGDVKLSASLYGGDGVPLMLAALKAKPPAIELEMEDGSIVVYRIDDPAERAAHRALYEEAKASRQYVEACLQIGAKQGNDRTAAHVTARLEQLDAALAGSKEALGDE